METETSNNMYQSEENLKPQTSNLKSEATSNLNSQTINLKPQTSNLKLQTSFEVCSNSVESCLEAQKGGADRVELCSGIPEGGTTPSYGEIIVARRLLNRTRLHVIIRPRGGDFLYSELELERMKADIRACREIGVDGVVFGCLTADGSIDEDACRQLIAECGSMSMTFHRAFDRCRDPFTALEQIINLGFHRILTSGQQPTAMQGVALLHDLVAQSAGRIRIMAGSGVTETNILRIKQATKVCDFHFSARLPQPSKMVFLNQNIYMGTKGTDENTIMVTSADRVKATIRAALLDEIEEETKC